MNTFVQDLTQFLRYNYSPEEKIKEDKNGETTIFFRKGGKSLCYISIKGSKSTVTIVIGSSLEEKVRQSNIRKKTKEIFIQAKQFHDGKWLFFALNSKQELEDVKRLLLI